MKSRRWNVLPGKITNPLAAGARCCHPLTAPQFSSFVGLNLAV
jgi:hypothetical protein